MNEYQPTFKIFISSITMQAMIAMGKIENPLSKKYERNLPQAKFLIDTLEIIDQKTKNNLTQEEELFLKDALSDLKIVYMKEKGEDK